MTKDYSDEQVQQLLAAQDRIGELTAEEWKHCLEFVEVKIIAAELMLEMMDQAREAIPGKPEPARKPLEAYVGELRAQFERNLHEGMKQRGALMFCYHAYGQVKK